MLALAYQGITYRSGETGVDIGHATAERDRTLPLPPVLGIVGGGRWGGALITRLSQAHLESWPDIMTRSPSTRHTLTSVCCIVFAFFAVSASGVVGDPDVPLLVLVGLVALAVFSTLAAKRWHLGLTTPIGAARPLDASDARDLMRMDSDKG